VNVFDAVLGTVRSVPDALFVASLGTATSALRAASDDGPHLYLGGAMGSALATALGVAEKRTDRRVVALVGDGELLMGASSLWTLAGSPARNINVVVLSDGRYGIAGRQPLGVEPAFARVAQSLGLPAVAVDGHDGLVDALASNEFRVVDVRCSTSDRSGPSPFVDPPVVRARFERAVSR
jgi:thiamine pyrophosphate-dependent acetolactate synthase large subunit-like protein